MIMRFRHEITQGGGHPDSLDYRNIVCIPRDERSEIILVVEVVRAVRRAHRAS